MTEKYKRLLQSSKRIAAAASDLCESTLKDSSKHVENLCSALDDFHDFLAKEFTTR